VPIYAYKGVTNSGKAARGSVNAENARAARSTMRTQGIFLTELAETNEATRADAEGRFGIDLSQLSILNRIPAMELAATTRQLATLVSASIPLVEALGALVEQIEHKAMCAVISQIRERVNEGASLADAMATTDAFDNLYISTIRSGEASGALGLVLERLSDYLEDQLRLNNKVTSAMVYPVLMLFVALGIVSFLVTVVLPQITSLLLSLDATLPWITQVIISGSAFVRVYWWALALLGFALFVSFRLAVGTERGRWIYDRFCLQLPVLGRLIRLLAIARFSRTLSTMLASGVSIVKALDIAKHVANNTVIAKAIDSARVAIIEGASLAQPLKASGQFPAMATTMIEVGEASGELEAMLSKVADTYDEQVETAVTRLTALLEPLLILGMVGVVMVIVMATLVPLLQLTSNI
jgi:general secretion pathway protein F